MYPDECFSRGASLRLSFVTRMRKTLRRRSLMVLIECSVCRPWVRALVRASAQSGPGPGFGSVRSWSGLLFSVCELLRLSFRRDIRVFPLLLDSRFRFGKLATFLRDSVTRVLLV